MRYEVTICHRLQQKAAEKGKRCQTYGGYNIRRYFWIKTKSSGSVSSAEMYISLLMCNMVDIMVNQYIRGHFGLWLFWSSRAICGRGQFDHQCGHFLAGWEGGAGHPADISSPASPGAHIHVAMVTLTSVINLSRSAAWYFGWSIITEMRWLQQRKQGW